MPFIGILRQIKLQMRVNRSGILQPACFQRLDNRSIISSVGISHPCHQVTELPLQIPFVVQQLSQHKLTRKIRQYRMGQAVNGNFVAFIQVLQPLRVHPSDCNPFIHPEAAFMLNPGVQVKRCFEIVLVKNIDQPTVLLHTVVIT
ncbi:hypothetical protein D3C80_1430850 [compost metagenome]